ncbi:type III-B CRISPR module-associated Cmr3 family protein [Iocasia frigidifontis]|nr:type III-B CRISPR module-associated Cmr3 family protein [Iocasia fonsfrigidae]
MKMLKIKPNDNLFFGDGKRFDKGESAWLHSKLLPYPSAFKGAIASVMLKLNKIRRDNYIGKQYDAKNDPRKYLRIGRVFLYDEKNYDLYMPAPLDLFINKKNKCKYGLFSKITKNYTSSLNELEYLLYSPGKQFERVEDSYINHRSFYNSYLNTYDSIGFISREQIISSAYKVGIQKDRKKGNAQEDHLYRIDLTEFKGDSWSYLVEYDIKDKWWEGSKINSLGDGYLKLGGENKSCKYYELSAEKIINHYSKMDRLINETEFVKLYFMSPVIFNNGSFKPSFTDLKIDITVVGASTVKPYYIGGFDMKKKNQNLCVRLCQKEQCIY